MKPGGLSPVTFDPLCYRINGKPVYLYSGEFHYFRVPRKDWRRRMRFFREAGGNCVATYVPWLIHESEENRVVFGSGGPQLDLEAFLDAAAAEGLYVIARPGPYQYSELKYDGLPGWLCEGYPELHAHNLDGKVFRTSSISYLHPLFLEKTRRWFDQVVPILARHTVSTGGPIAFVQFDNELAGIHTWFGSLDYNAETMGFGQTNGRYPVYLRNRHGDMRRLNELYGTSHGTFEEVRPVAFSSSGDPATVRRLRDYFHFYLGTVAEYGATLAGYLRERGIDVPLVHNAAGPAMNAWFTPMVRAVESPFILGSDHYYTLGQGWAQNNPTPQYALNCFYSLEMLRLLGMPPTVYELPGGSASDWPPITPSDAKACYLANVALGMKGSNFYIFTGGPNLPGTGNTTDIYDYGASIGAFGEVRPLYRAQKEVGLFLKRRPWLMTAERMGDCRIALDWEHPVSGSYWSARGGFLFSGSDAWSFLLKGMLTTAFCASLSPVFVDLDCDDGLEDRSAPLVVVCSSTMARSKQERLVRHLATGGRALIAPVLPAFDENLEPCSVLADYLGTSAPAKCTAQFVRLSVAGVVNILNNGEVFFFDRLPADAEVLGTDEVGGRTVAWRRGTGKGGTAIVLGFQWVHAMREHERMVRSLLALLGLEQRVVCSNPNVWVSLRTAGRRSAVFLLNLLSAPMEVEVGCRLAGRKRMVNAGRHRLQPMSVKVVEL